MTVKEYIQNNIVTVYFSKDRPMQLDLALSTNQKNCFEWNYSNEIVIYKASDERFLNAYKKLAKEHSSVSFINETNFKQDLYSAVSDKEYVLFVVDDCIFTTEYSLAEMYTNLQMSRALGFSLRLGKNTKLCYPYGDRPNDIPTLIRLKNSNVFSFVWSSVKFGDFAYPLEVSSSMYQVSKIWNLITGLPYGNPNELEWGMSNHTNLFYDRPLVLCYETSVAFCNPLNRVQNTNTNRTGSNPEYSIDSLLTKYEKCGIINTRDFEGFVSTGCHQEVDIEILDDTLIKGILWNEEKDC